MELADRVFIEGHDVSGVFFLVAVNPKGGAGGFCMDAGKAVCF